MEFGYWWDVILYLHSNIKPPCIAMKHFLLPVLIIILFASCKSNTKKTTQDSLKTPSVMGPSSKIMAEFKYIINGQWIKSDYIAEIVRSKSPLKAWPKAFDITEIFINVDSIRGDSLNISVNYTYHEGGSFILKFHKGQFPNSITVYQEGGNIDNKQFEIGFNISNRDTSLLLYTYGQNKKLIRTDKFSRLKANKETTKNGSTEASYYWINKLTIGGGYEMIDTSDIRSKVEFKNNGEVTGLEQFKTYSLAIDFTTPPNDIDLIYFGLPNNNSKPFIYQFKKDTLCIYDTRYDKDSVQLLIEKLKYKMVKQKLY